MQEAASKTCLCKLCAKPYTSMYTHGSNITVRVDLSYWQGIAEDEC